MPTIVSGSEYLSLPRAKETWLIKPVLPTSGAVLLYGDPKVGKSFAALQLAEAVASPSVKEWFGFPVTEKGKVVYVQLDTPRSLWTERLEDMSREGFDVSSIHFADKETLDCFPFDILRPDHFDLLHTSLKEINPAVVIMDTLKESNSEKENDATSQQKVMASLVHAVYPAALVVVSHARKPGEEGAHDIINDNRGSSYLTGRMDSILRFSKKTMYFVGRALESGSVRMGRSSTGMWIPDNSPDKKDLDELATQLINDPTYPTVLQKAVEFSVRTGKSREASRTFIRNRLPIDYQQEG